MIMIVFSVSAQFNLNQLNNYQLTNTITIPIKTVTIPQDCDLQVSAVSVDHPVCAWPDVSGLPVPCCLPTDHVICHPSLRARYHVIYQVTYHVICHVICCAIYRVNRQVTLREVAFCSCFWVCFHYPDSDCGEIRHNCHIHR